MDLSIKSSRNQPKITPPQQQPQQQPIQLQFPLGDASIRPSINGLPDNFSRACEPLWIDASFFFNYPFVPPSAFIPGLNALPNAPSAFSPVQMTSRSLAPMAMPPFPMAPMPMAPMMSMAPPLVAPAPAPAAPPVAATVPTSPKPATPRAIAPKPKTPRAIAPKPSAPFMAPQPIARQPIPASAIAPNTRAPKSFIPGGLAPRTAPQKPRVTRVDRATKRAASSEEVDELIPIKRRETAEGTINTYIRKIVVNGAIYYVEQTSLENPPPPISGEEVRSAVGTFKYVERQNAKLPVTPETIVQRRYANDLALKELLDFQEKISNEIQHRRHTDRRLARAFDKAFGPLNLEMTLRLAKPQPP